MPRLIVSGAIILTLALFSPCSAMQVNSGQPVATKNSPVKRGSITQATPAVQRSVESVFIDTMEGGTIYSKDGRTFQTGGARIINNSRKATGPKQAELFYENGSLVEVILR